MDEIIYPVGEQDFPKLREMGRFYVDKTALIHRLVTRGNYYFLNRPRRFGKSLLLSTLEAYFQGRRELFQGLAIEQLERDWTPHPVLRLDMSRDKFSTVANLLSMLDGMLAAYERQYGITPADVDSHATRLNRLIEIAYEQTGQRVVVLVDEYDAPLLDSLTDTARLQEIRSIMRGVYSPLKAQAARLRFVLLSGITKFAQLSIFSELNNLMNISMSPEYEALCGITGEEIATQIRPGVEALAEYHHCTPEQMLDTLRRNYDGYHFSHAMTADVYNPFSLMKVFQYKELDSYWFESGMSSWLIELLRKHAMELPDMERVKAASDDFNRPTEREVGLVPLLYQGGYLTIKGYNRERELYDLGIPNQEVRRGLSKDIMYYTGPDLQSRSFMREAYFDLMDTGDVAAFMPVLTDFFRSIPYDISSPTEKHYQALLYTMLVAQGADVSAEDRTSDGRIDIVLRMPREIYVIELKLGHTAAEAMEQLRRKDYAAKYRHDGRPVRQLAININPDIRTIDDWLMQE
ncbi:MAG: ATP-binding protein [Muribaculaceae bacterium]|nr:ATP-binding protein [Muribaculaceae bacterium]